MEAAVKKAQLIFSDYSDLLAVQSSNVVRDIKILPHAKEQIKTSTEIMLRLTGDVAVKEQIKIMFLGLATFQPMTGSQLRAVRTFSSINKDDNFDVDLIAKAGPEFLALQDKIAAEMEALKQELKNKGLW